MMSEESHPNKLQFFGFHLYDTFEMTKFRNGGQICDCQNLGMEIGVGWGKRKVGMMIKAQHEGSL